MKNLIFYFIFFVLSFASNTSFSQVDWKVQELVKDGRIDAIADLGDGVVIAGSRWPNPGIIFRSTDYGISWKKVKTITVPKGAYHDNEILCLMGGPGNYAYLITSNAQFWRSRDKGLTWKRMTQLGGKLGVQSFSYSICVTPLGTVLATSGFSIYRSTDNGLHFEKIGPITDHYLYRLQLVGKEIFVNGWGGTLFRSINDGKTWQYFAKLGPATDPSDPSREIIKTQPYLTAIECFGGDVLLQGTMSGENYTTNRYHSSQIKLISKVEGSLDDYVYLGHKTVIASTFTANRDNYISYDGGESWKDIGSIPTGVKGDWLDHEIRLGREDSVIVIGGTHKGFIVRATFSRKRLYKLSNPNIYPSISVVDKK